MRSYSSAEKQFRLITDIEIEDDLPNWFINFKDSFLCCSDNILLNLQISRKHTLEEIIILDL